MSESRKIQGPSIPFCLRALYPCRHYPSPLRMSLYRCRSHVLLPQVLSPTVHRLRSVSVLLSKKSAKRPVSKVSKCLVSKVSECPVSKASERLVSKVSKFPVSKVSERPVSKVSESPVLKFSEQFSVSVPCLCLRWMTASLRDSWRPRSSPALPSAFYHLGAFTATTPLSLMIISTCLSKRPLGTLGRIILL